MTSALPSIVALSLCATLPSLACAQAWEVPLPDAHGDYTTALVAGNRGPVKQTKWLVTAVDPAGLNCRSYDLSRILGRLPPGAFVEAVFPENTGNAVHIISGAPWLLVRAAVVPWPGIYEGACYVRANRTYVAPVNLDFL